MFSQKEVPSENCTTELPLYAMSGRPAI